MIKDLLVIIDYFIPAIPFIIISLVASTVFLLKTKFGLAIKIALYYLFILYFFLGVRSLTNELMYRYDYKNSIAYLSYNYIINNFTKEKHIYHDHFVAVPEGWHGYHYWNNDVFHVKPNVIIYSDTYRVKNNERFHQADLIDSFLAENHFKKITTICGTAKDVNTAIPICVGVYGK